MTSHNNDYNKIIVLQELIKIMLLGNYASNNYINFIMYMWIHVHGDTIDR